MYLGRWYRTLRDIPARQLLARLNFEVKKTFFTKLPPNLKQQLDTVQKLASPPLRQDYLTNLKTQSPIPTTFDRELANYEFTFLNETRSLSYPIPWNSSDYSRLWQFNLHYFDWIREDLEAVYQNPQTASEKLQKISHCIEDWITANPAWSFDGWHPYTTSLRIVNWTFALRAFPQLTTPKLLDSLWQQICFLDRNKEFFAGGNHLLENLRALIVGGLNFESAKADRIVRKSLALLEKQIQIQVLNDGGHYELSPMYHLLMVNLVGECVVCLRSANCSVPPRILSTLEQMLSFVEAIRLTSGQYPLWNDCAYGIAPTLDTTRDWIRPLCRQQSLSAPPELQTRLLQSAQISLSVVDNPATQNLTSHLATSGYHVLRQGDLEVAFDGAAPCPKDLPPHAHADCLSIDVYWRGQPLIIETGTSQYGSGPVRNYERSTCAHNAIALSASPAGDKPSRRFEDQSEIWGSFRVGRKAQPFGQRWGHDHSWQWVQAAHDGYQRSPFQTAHHRWVGICDHRVVILDHLDASLADAQSDIRFRSHFHLAPGFEVSFTPNPHQLRGKLERQPIYLELIGIDPADQVGILSPAESSSWYAPEFGHRLPRSLLRIEGSMQPNSRFLGLAIGIGEPPHLTWHLQDHHLHLSLRDQGDINCYWRNTELSTTISY
jgi:uncharacterized heparinase superfamily protein